MLAHALKIAPLILRLTVTIGRELKTELITLSCAELEAFWEGIDLVNCSS